MLSQIDKLKVLTGKVRTAGVSDIVDKISGIFSMLTKTRDEVSAEWRVRIAAEKARVEAIKADRSSAKQISSSETRLLDAIAAIGKKIN